MSEGTEGPRAPQPGWAVGLRWLGMIAAIVLGLGGLAWLLKLAGRG